MNPHLLAALLAAALAEPPPPPPPPRDRRGPETLSPPEGANLHVGGDLGNRSSEITFIHKARWARWTEDREEKLAKAAAKRLRKQDRRVAEGRHRG